MRFFGGQHDVKSLISDVVIGRTQTLNRHRQISARCSKVIESRGRTQMVLVGRFL